MSKSADAFRTISEVADELDLHKHVLRFWEVKFPQIKPMKRGGGRRYYRPADLELLRGIRHLLHSEGYTIKGVQRIIREKGIDAVKRSTGGAEDGDGATRAEATSGQVALAETMAAEGDAPAAGARRGRAGARGSRIVEVANEIVARSRMPGQAGAPQTSASQTSASQTGASQTGRGRIDAVDPTPAAKLAPAHRQAIAAALTELRACRDMLRGETTAAAGAVVSKSQRISG